MSEIKNGKLGMYGAEHSKCNHVMTVGFKGLNQSKPELRAVDQMEYDFDKCCNYKIYISELKHHYCVMPGTRASHDRRPVSVRGEEGRSIRLR